MSVNSRIERQSEVIRVPFLNCVRLVGQNARYRIYMMQMGRNQINSAASILQTEDLADVQDIGNLSGESSWTKVHHPPRTVIQEKMGSDQTQ